MSAQARKALAASDPTMAALIERVGEIDIATRLARRKEERPGDAYGALLRAIVGQQLSTKAARTIYLRVVDLFGGSTPTPEQLLDASEADLRGCGLSGRKTEYLRDLAAHVLSGELELDRLEQLDDEEAIEEIVAVRGLGQWTAEMFLMFHLERPDVLSGGDLGIRKAIQVEYGLEEMPTPTGWSRSASPGGPIAASPRSTSGSRWRRCPHEAALLARDRRRDPGRGRLGGGGRARLPQRRQRLPRHAARRGDPRGPPDGSGGGALGRPARQRRRLLQSRGRPQQARVRGLRALAAAAGGAERRRLHPAGDRCSPQALRAHPRPAYPRSGRRPSASTARGPGRSTSRSPTSPPRATSRTNAARRSATTSATTPSAAPTCSGPVTGERPSPAR